MKKILQVIALLLGAFIVAILVTMALCSYVLPMRLSADCSFNGKYGYLDHDCKLAIPAKFERAEPFQNGLAVVSIKGSDKEKYGFINHSGKFVIEPTYDFAQSFSEGLADVLKNDKYGFVDSSGHLVIAPQFDYAGTFSDGLALVHLGNKIGFVDPKGTWVFTVPRSWRVLDFSQGLAPVSIDEKHWGFIDKTGKIVIKPVFDRIWWYAETYKPALISFSKGLAGVCIDALPEEKWGFIDKKGSYVVQPKYKRVQNFHDGLAAVCTEIDARGERWGYVNEQGQMVIKPIYGFAYPFGDELAAVNIGGNYNGSWGFIDHNGNWVIAPQFDKVGSFSEGLAEVTPKISWSNFSNDEDRILIDKKGNRHCAFPSQIDGLQIIEPNYLLGTEFCEGLTPVQIGKWTYKGEVLDPAKMKQERLFARLVGLFPVASITVLSSIACILAFIVLYGYIKRKRSLSDP